MQRRDKTDYIILHCSDTEDDGDTLQWPAIKRYHLSLGWSDIGYHFGVEERAGIVLLPGRDREAVGSHCRAGGRNHDSIGVCVVGQFDEDAPTPKIFAATVKALAWLCLFYDIPSKNVRGHREFEPNKTCPGEMWDLDHVRECVGLRTREVWPEGRHIALL